jgi:ABC-type dipeptide/oligopeptide/nickel transport system permease subunit
MGISPTELSSQDVSVEPETALVKHEIAGRSPTQIALGRIRADKIAMACVIIVVIFFLIAIFAGPLTHLFGVKLGAGTEADTDDLGFPLIGPPFHGFTWKAPLGLWPGTGDDLLAQWFYGARTSLTVATIATVVATLVGIVMGLLAGFSRGWLDKVITFIVDLFLSLPYLLVALSIAPILISRYGNNAGKLKVTQFIALLIVLSMFGWMTLARLVRGQVLSLREQEFVQAARVIGVPTRTILFKELLPNLVAPIIVSISLGLPGYVAAEATLAYLGIGVVGIASWGQTINAAVGYFNTYPLFLYAPVVGICVLVIALNLLGDAVRDAFDPKTRR